ncbi:TraR/DksA family transcriptional regulator [Pseudonocardia asaccharolytica]|uniref:Zinc finger DksA/TraR C4-type domain-containing protein n=1 Tax=Pseudonocardia asaccharolytica DSM 44247 = NBRC 16224 TaxID=1123024 RepID=A0A511D3R5_9PSEU|nr:TraR/DksA C4-type zinc finger protein [Pseudonocardia asaccharolytica]GEL19422.1 hypothetical protein PA7_32590 [Pseudonocardia asaccharolytica DSM 44247 = NBRC 16224]
MNPDRARQLLTAELAELDERSHRADIEADQPLDDPVLGTHPGDHGSEVAAQMDNTLLADTVAEQRRRVVRALERLEGGSYGRCAVCGTRIDDERLEARPEVATCREHADSPIAGE